MAGGRSARSGGWRPLVLALCVLLVSACAASTEHLSPAQVSDKLHRLATPEGSIRTFTVYFVSQTSRTSHERTMFLACPPSRTCILMDRHGTTYEDMQEYVDESDDVTPGFDVLANSDPLHPEQRNPKLAEYTPSSNHAVLVFAGSAALLVLLLAAGWWALRRQRRSGDPSGPPAPDGPGFS